jgi:hypothetical protein
MNIFVVESPLQLLNAIEARQHFGVKESDAVLIILEGASPQNAKDVMAMSAICRWAAIHNIAGNTRAQFLQRLVSLNSLANQYRDAQRVFIGDIRSQFMRHIANRLAPATLFQVDDGAGVLSIRKSLDSTPRFSLTDRIKMMGFGFQLALPRNINFFTAYDMTPFGTGEVVRNSYSFLRANMITARQDERHFFLGTSLVEINIVSEKDYLDALKRIREATHYEDIVYIPHRRECMGKLALVGELGFDVVKVSGCIEVYFAKQGITPKSISSFYSSALINLELIFGDLIPLRAYRLCADKINAGYIDRIEDVYSYFSTNTGIEIAMIEGAEE